MLVEAQTLQDPPQILDLVPLTDIPQTDQFSSTLVMNLFNSCSKPTAEQLSAADAVMERIYKLGYNNNKQKKLNSDSKVYVAGNLLYKITQKMFKNKLTPSDCQQSVKDLDDILFESKISL